MKTKRSQEGYLLIDHRFGYGLDASATIHGAEAIGAGAIFESPTITCSHCQRVVVMNPARTRSRGYCPKCDHFVCDACEVNRVKTGICRPFNQIIEEHQESIATKRIML